MRSYRPALVAGIVLLFMATGVATASGTSRPSPIEGRAGAWATASLVGGIRAADGPSVITCTPKVNYPHNSSHVGGTINVQVTMSCTYPVDKISITASLWRGNSMLKAVNGISYGKASNASNAPIACAPGSYYGMGTWVVTFPYGYVPRVQTGGGQSVVRAISC